jgi:hypothetical protein
MRAGALMLAVLLLAGCVGASEPTSSPAPTGTPAPGLTDPPASEPPGGPTAATDGWRELAAGVWLGDEVFAVAAATNDAQLAELWHRLGRADPPPAVDFERELVLFLGMSGSSSCPERLQRLIVDFETARVHGEWAERDPMTACTDDLQAQGVLLAVDRAQLPDEPFELSLRDRPICPECDDRPDRTIVDPAA